MPGVWIHYEKRWVQAAEVCDGFADAPLGEMEREGPEPTIASLYPDWHREALCLGEDEEAWFGARDTTERPALSVAAVAAAQRICGQCPVFTECLTTALEDRNEYGIWAGTSGRTRRRIWEAIDAGETTIPEVVTLLAENRGGPKVVRRSA